MAIALTSCAARIPIIGRLTDPGIPAAPGSAGGDPVLWTLVALGALLVVLGMASLTLLTLIPLLPRSAAIQAIGGGIGLIVVAWLLSEAGWLVILLAALTYVSIAVAYAWGWMHNRKIIKNGGA